MSNKKPTTLTPRGVAIYPHLNTADTKWHATGKFHTKLAMAVDDPQVQAFIAELEQLRDEKYQEVYDALVADKKLARAKEVTKSDVVKAEVDEETGDETGRVIISVSMNHKVTSKKDGKTYTLFPKYINAKREQLQNPPRIGGGSLLRCLVTPDAYFKQDNKSVGVSLRLDTVQLIKLVSGGQRDFAAAGFEEEEDGDDISDVADTPAPEASSRGANEDDDL